MLTSGSTGNPKAVCLHHGQIIHALQGKRVCHRTNWRDVFLNWTGLDHVANLTEIHLHATALAAMQVHILEADVLADPKLFLEMISSYKATYTFAPNFFLAALVRTIESLPLTLTRRHNRAGKYPYVQRPVTHPIPQLLKWTRINCF
jgi:acyl-CoA synthetase (AMP-forming)/AMP-acid ligase II